ncbi:MAG: hypothetical protein IRZ16_15465 [Myxococcaceae bacterium]|nr:hypothetical protein [Myxococcaceae bacterium]
MRQLLLAAVVLGGPASVVFAAAPVEPAPEVAPDAGVPRPDGGEVVVDDEELIDHLELLEELDTLEDLELLESLDEGG